MLTNAHESNTGDPMSNVAEALAEEFAGKGDVIHKLKMESAHFRKLMELNETLYREIQRIQSGQEPAGDEEHESLEKRRLAVLDEIAGMIAAAERG